MGDRQSMAHILSPLRGSFLSIPLCAGAAPLPVLRHPRRGLVGGLKVQHAASPGHRPGEHGNPYITPCKGRTIMLLPLPGVEDMSLIPRATSWAFEAPSVSDNRRHRPVPTPTDTKKIGLSKNTLRGRLKWTIQNME